MARRFELCPFPSLYRKDAMNIFYLSHDPKEAAEFHCDKHVNKMLLESVQMLCTTNHVCGRRAGYKATHTNHPCAIWVRSSRHHYRWLVSLVHHLHEEWRKRYGHGPDEYHKAFRIIEDFDPEPKWLADKQFKSPPRCMPDEFKVDDVVQSYRNYYHSKQFAKWAHGPTPTWWQGARNEQEATDIIGRESGYQSSGAGSSGGDRRPIGLPDLGLRPA